MTRDVLERLLGGASASALLYYAPADTVANKPEEFSNSMTKLLGSGARFVLAEIVDEAYRRLGTARNAGSDFAPAIRKLMKERKK